MRILTREDQPVQDFETGLWLVEDQWLAFWYPEITYDEWENARQQAIQHLIPQNIPTLAQQLTRKARKI